jgi:hypothetical protein
VVILVVGLIAAVLGLLYLDRVILLTDAKKLEAEVVTEIEKVIAGVESGAQADVQASLNKLKEKL